MDKKNNKQIKISYFQSKSKYNLTQQQKMSIQLKKLDEFYFEFITKTRVK